MSFHPLIALGLFAGYVVLDGLYAVYTLAVAQHRPVRAASAGAVMYFLMAAGVLAFTGNFLYVIPCAAGSWAGTWLVVRHEARRRA